MAAAAAATAAYADAKWHLTKDWQELRRRKAAERELNEAGMRNCRTKRRGIIQLHLEFSYGGVILISEPFQHSPHESRLSLVPI